MPAAFQKGNTRDRARRANAGSAAIRHHDPSCGVFQGHVDTTGKVLKKTLEGDSLWVEIEVNDPDLLACIVPKGYVAVDGTSLTVCDCVEIKFYDAFDPHAVVTISTGVVSRNDGRGWFLFRFRGHSDRVGPGFREYW